MVNSSLEEKYLGVPAIIGPNKKVVFAYIKDKVWRRLCGWNRKLLSCSGKEILLKAIAQAIPSFVMIVFLLPTSLCTELERMMNSFWWGRNQKERPGMNWAAWDRLCLPKSEGGLALKNLHHHVSLIAKQAWHLLSRPQSLVARIFKAKYFPNGGVLEAKLGSSPSYIWSIHGTLHLVKAGAR